MIDVLLGGVGAGLAVTAAGLAIYMVQAGGEPRINGIEHLTVFAQLKSVPPRRARNADPGEDDLATGSIAPRPAPPRRPAMPFRVVEAREGRARIAAEGRVWQVAVGDVTPLFGRVRAIRRGETGWIVETEAGPIGENE